jgi:integration host factor subunit alpha
MTLTKESLITALPDHLGFSKSEGETLTETLLELIKKTLESGEDLLISGFGKFCVKEKNKRKGRNPATGDDLMLDARRVVTFRCSPILRKKIDKKPAKGERIARAGKR